MLLKKADLKLRYRAITFSFVDRTMNAVSIKHVSIFLALPYLLGLNSYPPVPGFVIQANPCLLFENRLRLPVEYDISCPGILSTLLTGLGVKGGY